MPPRNVPQVYLLGCESLATSALASDLCVCFVRPPCPVDWRPCSCPAPRTERSFPRIINPISSIGYPNHDESNACIIWGNCSWRGVTCGMTFLLSCGRLLLLCVCDVRSGCVLCPMTTKRGKFSEVVLLAIVCWKFHIRFVFSEGFCNDACVLFYLTFLSCAETNDE